MNKKIKSKIAGRRIKSTIRKLYEWSQTFWGDLLCCLAIGIAGWVLFYFIMWILWIMGVMA